MSPDKKSTPSTNKSISINGDVKDSAVIIGDNNTVNQTIIQKFFNIFKSDSETLEHCNRRILLGHVENAWIKGVLDASLHGAALLDLGIKQDPEAVTKYPWAIKKESTDETLPAGTSMLEIFDSIGMGRSLLILGAPGSGKTTMLLELARQLIQRAREDVIAPIPMVFNLASWTEKLTLADWLAQELNNLYSVPRKTAPDWVKGDKLLLLLDGLDEVRQESRAKCVEAINAFRKEHGLTSLAVCSRSQDYADLKAKLSFEGAIEVQPLTQEQITEFFNRFGDETAGIKQALEKDSGLREMAETPLFLSIMLMAYRGKREGEILISGDEMARHKHLFDTYVQRMFERPRFKSVVFKEQDILNWLSWLSQQMRKHELTNILLEQMQPDWLNLMQRIYYRFIVVIIFVFIFSTIVILLGETIIAGLVLGLIIGLVVGMRNIQTVDTIKWSWRSSLLGVIGVVIGGLFGGLSQGLIGGLSLGLFAGLLSGLLGGLKIKKVNETVFISQKILASLKNSLAVFFLVGLIVGAVGTFVGVLYGTFGGKPVGNGIYNAVVSWLFYGAICGLFFGGVTVVTHYSLRLSMAMNNLLPWRLVPFLDHCVDLIFLRRVGGGYIFVHRLLMEHFAEMYVETPTSRETKNHGT